MLTKTPSLFILLLVTLSTVTALQFNYAQSSEVLRTTDNRIRGAQNRLNKDFVFGGLIPVHSDDPGSGGGQCGAIRTERGLERMEAMLFAVDLINNDSELLAGLEIGYDIRDTCNSENIGLDETIDLVITGSQLDIQSCQLSSMAPNNMVDNISINPPTSGIIGAAASRVSVPVASLVRLFQIPQISYASSSAILSNRDRYEYFYRTIPPDDQQARAMLDILLNFNWTYVSTIYSRNPYGEPGITEFRKLASKNGICIDLDMGIEDISVDSDFDTLADALIASSANIVIVFASQDNAEQVLRRIANSTIARTRFTWIASDAWARSNSVVNQFSETAAGLYGIAPLTEHVTQFNEYFSQLTIDSNVRNPWFTEYYAAFANCDVLNTSVLNACSQNESVTGLPQYQQGNVVPLVIDAVYAYAHALQNFLHENCQLPIQWDRTNQSCAGQSQQLTGSVLLQYIRQLDFVNNITGNRIIFDSQGNVEGKYEILNYQANGDIRNGDYFFSRAGIWDSSVLNDSNLEALSIVDMQSLQFGIDNSTNSIRRQPQISQCGRCEVGEYRRIVQSSCCGTCDPCVGGNYSSNPMGLQCLQCGGETWGNNPLVGSDSCVPIPDSFIRYSDAFSIIVIILAVLGLIAVAAVTITYVIYWKTPVVKSSGREQMITLLSGIGLIFILAFVYVSPPEPGVCAVQRMGFWVCYSIIFGALLVKIVRVTRIFYRSANLSRTRFTEPYYQVIFTSIIIFGQVLIVVIGLIVVHPGVSRNVRLNREDQNKLPEIIVSCVVDHVAILVICAIYETILIIASTILGVLSFKYPKNFNEAKFVSFCTFIIAIIWAAFVGLYAYFIIEERQEIQNAITGLASVLSAFAVLGCLFGPKLFIIFFRPDQNKPNQKVTGSQDTAVNLTTITRNPSSEDTLSTMKDNNSMSVKVSMTTKTAYAPTPPSLKNMDSSDDSVSQ
ncbi:metabotropic glutamate receptor 3-like isoform X2 [Halichondria panicea]